MEYGIPFVASYIGRGDNVSLSPGTPSSIGTGDPQNAGIRALLTQRMHRGASWFFTIAVLSGVNTVLQISNAKVHFILGLGITDVVDHIARGRGQNGMIAMILIDGLFVVMLVLCGVWARHGSQASFMVGMIAYGLDGVLLLVYGGWIEGLVHGYALWRLWDGYAACSELDKLNQNVQPGMSQVKLP